jgi:streptomycin 6-kinase
LKSIEAYVSEWRLYIDGEVIRTRSSLVVPVVRDGHLCMLKLATALEEKRGNQLMSWWAGRGAASVLRHDEHAVLLQRACGSRSLEWLSLNGGDDEATEILCASACRLHVPKDSATPELVPLISWFESLRIAAAKDPCTFGAAWETASQVLARPFQERVLHGDVHHGNVLDFGDSGWLAIDPKGLYGDPGYDFANIFHNPTREISCDQKTFLRRLEIVSRETGMNKRTLLQWIIGYSFLSAAWSVEDGDSPEHALVIGELAQAVLASGA